MIVIGIIGPKAAGKETIALHIAKKYGGMAHSHSEILDEILELLQLPITRENQIKLVALRKTFGPEALTRALAKKIRNENAPIEVITGIRFDSEFEHVRKYPQNIIIYVDADPELRFEWSKQRGQKRDKTVSDTYEHFLAYEAKETEVHIRELGRQADYKIQNTGTLKDLLGQVDAIMEKVLKTN